VQQVECGKHSRHINTAEYFEAANTLFTEIQMFARPGPKPGSRQVTTLLLHSPGFSDGAKSLDLHPLLA
jgi:hypothetical protein